MPTSTLLSEQDKAVCEFHRIKDCEFQNPDSEDEKPPTDENPISDDEVDEEIENKNPAARKPGRKNTSMEDLEAFAKSLKDPLPCFWAQLLFLSPDRKDQREKVIALIESNLSLILSSAESPGLIESFVGILTKMTYHEKSTIRTIALEMMGCLPVVYSDEIGLRIFGPVLARCSDNQPNVRSRAIDVLCVMILKGLDWAVRAFNWQFLLTVFHLRVHDEKSTVRKSAIGFVEVFISYCRHQGKFLGDFIHDDYLMILIDDASLTVRQKALSVLISLLDGKRDPKAQCLAMRGILQSALDNEDSIASKAREAVKNEVFGSLLDALKSKSEYHALLDVIDSSAESSETFYRVTLILCRES